MGTTADKLNKIVETKEAIRQAISDKGVAINYNTPFADYPKKINIIEGGTDSKFDLLTNGNTNYSYLFYRKDYLTEVDISDWNTSNVTTMEYMFSNCSNLKSINFGELDTTSCSPGKLRYMFQSCNNLQELRVDNYNLIYQICKNNTGLSTSAIDGVTKTIYCKEYIGANLTPPTNWVFSYTGTKEASIKVCSCVSTTEAISFYSSSAMVPMIQVATDNGNGTYNIDIKNFNSCSFDMGSMFDDCSSLISLDLSGLDTSKATNMGSMFYDCSALTSLDLNGWDTSNTTNIVRMFYNCSALTTLNVSGWDTSKFTSFLDLFGNCSTLISLDLSDWTTPSVTNALRMFNCCSSLTTLDIRNFDLSNCTSNGNMFDRCTSLHTLRLDNCNNYTINKIITSSNFPTEAIDGKTRTIYCKEANATGLTPPTNWVFSYID